ncbi:hypothetical protein Tco_1066921 [Tanacetum coccineum]|uniref:Uncharacterized protein n=1 Tax=Tanacetum coccineum TaxID=301880 RepID=A0ABQ5HCA0_9ASTR
MINHVNFFSDIKKTTPGEGIPESAAQSVIKVQFEKIEHAEVHQRGLTHRVTSSGDETSSGIVSDEEIDKQKLRSPITGLHGKRFKEDSLKNPDLMSPSKEEFSQSMFTVQSPRAEPRSDENLLNLVLLHRIKDAKSHNTNKEISGPLKKKQRESQKPERLIPKDDEVSPRKPTTVPKKTRGLLKSCLRLQPDGARILKTLCLMWVSRQEELFNSCTSKNALYNERGKSQSVVLLKFFDIKKPVPEWFHKKMKSSWNQMLNTAVQSLGRNELPK